MPLMSYHTRLIFSLERKFLFDVQDYDNLVIVLVRLTKFYFLNTKVSYDDGD